MCGIVGMMKNGPVAIELYDSLFTLQHRGQDAAGILTYDGRFRLKKGRGLAREVFHAGNLARLKGNVGLGHVRYITAGGASDDESQPFLTESPYGIALVHNGNLTNYDVLKKEVETENLRHLNTNSDSELLLHVLADELLKQNIRKLKPENIFDAIKKLHKRVTGSYAVIVYIAGHGMLAFRDPVGIRPLALGVHDEGIKNEYIVASEDVTICSLGFKKDRDIKNGEAIFIDEQHNLHSMICADKEQKSCIFEYVYLARPDSMIDDVSVYKSRIRMGEKLAKYIKERDWDIDVVMPVPDSARTTALQIATELQLPYREGIVKNRYIGRTFIMPGQAARQKSVKYKLNTIDLEIRGKNILLVEDSIVRGNTSRKIIQLVRDTGAKKVYFASAAPPLRFPCVYGIDMPTKKEFIATNLTEEEIAKAIDADGLIYQSLEDLVDACQPGKRKDMKFCTACFSGKYPTPEITQEKLDKMANTRQNEKDDSMNSDLLDSQLTLI